MSGFELPVDFAGVRFVVCTPEGRIVQKGACPKNDFATQQELHMSNVVVEGNGSPETHYVDGGAVVERPLMLPMRSKAKLVADGQDEIEIISLPPGCTATIDGQAYVLDDGTLTLTADTPHVYEIVFSHWPYLDKAMTVEATL